MKFIVFLSVISICAARPSVLHEHEIALDSVEEPIPIAIIRDDRVHNNDGSYSLDFETENGITVSEAGGSNAHGAITKIGSYSYYLPDGQLFTLKYVADENGFQPESPFLPVAPAFPHPIPQFVLDQIEFGNQQYAEAARLRQIEDNLRSSQHEILGNDLSFDQFNEELKEIQFRNPEPVDQQ